MTTMRSTRISLSFNWDQLIGETDTRSAGHTKAASEKVSVAVSNFCTGSKYRGQWDFLGMSGHGVYTYPYPVVYEGEMFDGMFHGEGTLIYPMGQKIKGIWHKGKLVEYKFSSKDNMEFSMDSPYLIMPNREFYVPEGQDLQPAGQEYLQMQQDRTIIPGCYDTSDGFYDPGTRSVRLSCDPGIIMGRRRSFGDDEDFEIGLTDRIIITSERAQWIEANCQRSWDAHVGYRPELYESWNIGRAGSVMELMENYENGSLKPRLSTYAGTGRILNKLIRDN